MWIKSILLFLCLSIVISCTTRPHIISDEMLKPVLEEELPKITDSMIEGTPVTVWWCLDDRFEGSPVSVISDWVQQYLEELLVNSKKFKMVTRIHLEKIFEEQKFQSSGHVDDDTIVSVARILGARFMVIPTITQYNAIEIQVLNSETGEIVYVLNRIIKDTWKISK